jgi:hypothetical protein
VDYVATLLERDVERALIASIVAKLPLENRERLGVPTPPQKHVTDHRGVIRSTDKAATTRSRLRSVAVRD